MKPRGFAKSLLSASVVTTTVFNMVVSPAVAGPIWDGEADQDWNNVVNWSADTAPTGNLIINNAGVGVFPIISAEPTDAGVIDIGVGVTGATGRLDQRAGTLDTGNNNWMRVGTDANSNGTFNLADTSVTGQSNLTTFGTGTGSVNIGGTSTTGGRLIIGEGNLAVGTVNVNTTGTLKTEIDTLGIILGNGGTSTGNINLDAGTVQVNALAANIGILIGTNGGDGNFRMSGGTVNVTGRTWIGDNNVNSAGLLQIGGGTYTTNGIEAGRTNGVGTITMTGGTLNSGDVLLARSTAAGNTGSATMTVGAGATVNSSGEFAVGYGGNGATGAAAGTYTLSGTHNQTGGVFNIGVFDSVKGTLTIESGAVLSMQNNTTMRMSVTAGNTTVNVVNQNGGTVTFYSDAGTSIGGTGVLDLKLAGGTSSSTYNLNGGTLTVGQIKSTSNNGTSTRVFNFNGGTLVAATGGVDLLNLNNTTVGQISATTRVNVRNGGALIETNNAAPVTISEALLHSDIGGDNAIDGGLTKTGIGTLTLSNANNTYTGTTTVLNGTLATDATGELGLGNVTIANTLGAILTLGNATGIADTATLLFGADSTVNLNFAGSDTLGTITNGTLSMGVGTHSANDLNSFFGVSTFTGAGALTIVPEPSVALLGGLGVLGLLRRRRIG